MTTPSLRLLSLTVLLLGCGSTSHVDLIPQPLAGLPSAFLGPGGVAAVVGAACRSPLRDPAPIPLGIRGSGRAGAAPR